MQLYLHLQIYSMTSAISLCLHRIKALTIHFECKYIRIMHVNWLWVKITDSLNSKNNCLVNQLSCYGSQL